MSFELRIIAAFAEGRVIGYKGGIPWSIAADRKRFEDRTNGKTVIVGRRTYESLPIETNKYGDKERLPGREIIVVTRDINFDADGDSIVYSYEDAVAGARLIDKVAYIAGGEELYRLALEDERLRRTELTMIHRAYPGDRHFPEYGNEWSEVNREERSFTRKKDNEVVRFSFVDLER